MALGCEGALKSNVTRVEVGVTCTLLSEFRFVAPKHGLDGCVNFSFLQDSSPPVYPETEAFITIWVRAARSEHHPEGTRGCKSSPRRPTQYRPRSSRGFWESSPEVRVSSGENMGERFYDGVDTGVS